MARHGLLPLRVVLLAACILCCHRTAQAVSWKLTKGAFIQSDLTAVKMFPPDNPDCTDPGVCKPAQIIIPNNTLWYWCGWNTKERSIYWVQPAPGVSTPANVTALLMREEVLQNCALPNLTSIKTCDQLTDSLCDTQTSCRVRVYGMAFGDPSCLLVANNGKAPAQVTVQMWQFDDSRRYYGTVFSIILLIIVLGLAVSNIFYTCYHQFRKPNHRLDELQKLTREKLQQESAASSNNASHGGTRDGPAVGFSDASEGLQGLPGGAAGGHIGNGAGSGGVSTPRAAAGPAGDGSGQGLTDGVATRLRHMFGSMGGGGKGGHSH